MRHKEVGVWTLRSLFAWGRAGDALGPILRL